jgi:hypothetical protein
MMNSTLFTPDYDYSGPAEVVFEDPHAEFFGPASVGPDEYGRPVVDVTVEHSMPTIQEGLDLAAIQLGSKTLPDGVRTISFGGGAPNKTQVTVQAKEGVFKAAPSWDYRFSKLSPDRPLTLRLTPLKSEYRVGLAREKFMVLPLCGFVSEFPKLSTVLHGHPLCVPGTLDCDTAGCITFQVNGEMAFVQQLPSADEGGLGIKPWSGETVLTAVAVIPIADPAMTDPWGWFLNVFLRLLGLASGSDVGTPWIEVRDDNGGLVRRLHSAINQVQPSVEGYAAIQKAIHWQNGEFLTAALSCAEAREPFLPIALKHCSRAGFPGLSLDDQLAHLIRGLESLCKRYGFSDQDLTDGLGPGSKKAVEGVLDTASAGLRKLAGSMVGPGRDQVSRIAQRTRSAAGKDRHFGLGLGMLVDHFGLLDSKVLGLYYAAHPGAGGRSWVESLSYYRGAVFHEGYVDLDSPATSVGEALGFILHLHDLLVRILLKIIGYRGTYQPRSVRLTAAETVDWFRPGINVDALLRVPILGIK